MFTTFSKILLYPILFICVIWGAILVGGPRALELLVSRTFGETVTLYNLRITPKFNILISRIEIKGAQFKGISIDGSLRSFEIKMAGFLKLKPVMKVSIGPSTLNELGSISKAKASIYFPEISLRGKSDVDLEFTDLTYQKAFSTKFVDTSSILDFQKGVLVDANFKALKIESLADMGFSSSLFEGSLSDWHFLENGLSPPASINLYFSDLDFPSEKIYLKNTSISSEFLENKHNMKMTFGDIHNEKKEQLASGVSANLITESFEPRSIEKIKINTDILYVPASDFMGRGEIIDLSINLQNNNFAYDLLANGKFRVGEVMVNELPIAKLSNSNFEITSTYKSKTNTSGDLMTDFTVLVEDEGSITIDAAATVEVSENNAFDCVVRQCFLSNFSLDYDLGAQNENLKGFFYCPKIPCESAELEHRFQTTNTSLFIKSATTSKVFNPVFLAFLYRSLLMGEKIGKGHFVRF